MRNFFVFFASFIFSIYLSAIPKNFVVIIADDISACDLTTYGNDFTNTHNIESLAQKGLVFDRAYLTASSCSPSRSSIITSRYPHNLGEASELHGSLPLHLANLPQLMRDNGYFTVQSGKSHFGGGKNSKTIVNSAFKIHDGGTTKEDKNTGSANWVNNLKKIPQDKPFFCWFASKDAHRPWDNYWIAEFGEKLTTKDIKVPEELHDDETTRKDLVGYYNELRRFDHRVGEVVKELERQDRLKDTFIIVLADNGRPFSRAKTRTNNDIGGKAMMIVYCPSYSNYAGDRTTSLVSTMDIAPTILELANIEKPESFQGVSFAKILKDKNATVRDYTYAEQNWHNYYAHVRTLRYKDYSYTINAYPNQELLSGNDIVLSDSHQSLLKFKKNGGKLNAMQADVFANPRASEEFYILSKDKHQVVNEINNPEYKEVVEKMRQVMQNWQKVTGDSTPEKHSIDKSDRNTFKDINKNFYGEAAGASNDAERINATGKIKD